MVRSTLLLTGAAALALAASNAQAVQSFGSASPTKSNGDFVAGSGIFADGFTIDTGANGETVALKARDRVSGQPIAQVANRYLVPQGMATPTRAAWNFDLQFSPGLAGNSNPAAYTYELLADINPGFGVATFQTIPIPSSVQAVPLGDSYYPNGTGGSISAGPAYSYNGAWSNATPFVIANSQNYNFGHLAGAGFANAGPAEYELVFTARDASTNAIVATTSVFAEVVPEPASFGVLGLAGGVAAMLRRRRR